MPSIPSLLRLERTVTLTHALKDIASHNPQHMIALSARLVRLSTTAQAERTTKRSAQGPASHNLAHT